MSVQLDATYTVVCHRGREDKLRRALYLDAVASEPGVFKHFAIYFVEQSEADDGGYVNPRNGFVVPTVPVADFDAMYSLVRREKKLFANWYAGDDDKLVWFQVIGSRDATAAGPMAVPLRP